MVQSSFWRGYVCIYHHCSNINNNFPNIVIFMILIISHTSHKLLFTCLNHIWMFVCKYLYILQFIYCSFYESYTTEII